MQKLKLLSLIFPLLFVLEVHSQHTFIVEQDTLELHREVQGPLTLYWVQEGTSYRYFVQKKNRLVELKNTEVEEDYIPQYKIQLRDLTPEVKLSTEHVKFLLYSLRHFVNTYNSMVQEDYMENEASENIKKRIGLFVGLSNNIFTENPDNVLAPVIGLEFEFYDPNIAPRHAAFLQLRQSFKRNDYRYSGTQLSVNYRFKVLYFEHFDVHVDAELATFLYAEDRIFLRNDQGQVTAVREDNGFSFTAPFSFGVGVDMKVTKSSYITFNYNDFYSVVLDGNDHFPLDFTVGYKYNL